MHHASTALLSLLGFIMIAGLWAVVYAAGTTPDTLEFENKHKSTIHQNWPAGDLEADQTIAQMLENIRAVAAQRKQVDLENNIPLKDLAENVGALNRSVDQLVQEVQQLTQNVTDIKTIAAQSTDPLVQMADALKNLANSVGWVFTFYRTQYELLQEQQQGDMQPPN